MFVFDVDETLVSTLHSYGVAAIKTAETYLTEVLGWNNIPDILFNLDDYCRVKEIEGFNSDYDVASLFILFMISIVSGNNSRFDRLKYEKMNFKEQNLTGDFVKKFQIFLNGVGSKPESYLSLIQANPPVFLKNNGDILATNLLENIFQQFYYGNEMFEKIYGNIPYLKHLNPDPLYMKEQLLVDFNDLRRLSSMVKLAVVTGRPKVDLDLFLESNMIEDLFLPDSRFFIENCVENGQSLLKPNPYALNQLIYQNPEIRQLVMFGDSINDYKMMLNAEKNNHTIRFQFVRVISPGCTSPNFDAKYDLMTSKLTWDVFLQFFSPRVNP